MLETLLEVMDLSQLDTSIRHAALADVTVTPALRAGELAGFPPRGPVHAGRQAAQEQLPALQALARPQSMALTTN